MRIARIWIFHPTTGHWLTQYPCRGKHRTSDGWKNADETEVGGCWVGIFASCDESEGNRFDCWHGAWDDKGAGAIVKQIWWPSLHLVAMIIRKGRWWTIITKNTPHWWILRHHGFGGRYWWMIMWWKCGRKVIWVRLDCSGERGTSRAWGESRTSFLSQGTTFDCLLRHIHSGRINDGVCRCKSSRTYTMYM